MNRCLTAAAGLALSLTTLVTSVQAVPPIMDRVPAGAAMAIVVPSVETLEKDVKGVMTLAGIPAEAFDVESMLAGSGLGGISRKGALALIVLDAPKAEGQEPPMVALCQGDDYAKLTKDLGATKEGDLDKASIDGEDVYMKSIGGGFVAIGKDKDVVAKFEGKPGSAEAHKKLFGSRGDKLSDKADVAFFFNVPKLKPMIDEGFAGMEQQLADMAAMTGQDGNEAQMKWIKEHIIADMNAGVAAVSIDAQGVSFDFAGVAKEESGLGKALNTAGKAHALLSKVPGGAYLAAYAVDLSAKPWRDFIKTMPKGENEGSGLGAIAGTGGAIIDDATGLSMVIGVPPGGIMSGLLTRATGYMATPNPEKVIAFYRDEMPKLLEKEQVGKMEYKPGATEIDGKKIDAFNMTITPDEGMQGMGPQIMQGMFGMTGGPSAYITAVDGGVVTTMSQSTEMMTAAIKASKGEGVLASDKVLSAVAEKLPQGRVVEGYLGVKGVLDTLLPMAAMFGGKPIKVEIPEKLPPVAGGVAIGEGQVHATFYVPGDVIKTGGELFRAFNAPAPDEDGGDNKEAKPAPKDEKPANPKF